MTGTVIVMLRQPNMRTPNEARDDPFWEFGSFGCTGCHRKNILTPKRAKELKGMRIAFAQGGSRGIRLVHLTPPVAVKYHSDRCELLWSPHQMPLTYGAAPVIIDNDGQSDTPAIMREIRNVSRSTLKRKFASKFRSRREPVQLELAKQLETAYNKHRRRKGAVAERYEEALPFSPPKVDRQRERTYRSRIADLEHSSSNCPSSTGCVPKRAPQC
jgi:hypothetical protein